jgi:ribonucleoside-diphosphate reductase alpha chain
MDSFTQYGLTNKSKISFFPTIDQAKKIQRIINSDETLDQMSQRVATTLFFIEKKFKTPQSEIVGLTQELKSYIDDKYCVMSTPIMINAGRHDDRPLSACTVPPIDIEKDDLQKIKPLIDQLHADGMGTGFNFNETTDPVATLKKLNAIAVEGAKSGKEDRPVGNMAVLSVHHPKILEFVSCKIDVDKNEEEWKFNLSIDVSEDFITAVKADNTYKLWDGTKLKAIEVLRAIATSSHRCGDPGLIFLSRLNFDNPTPNVGEYTSTAPCGEVGLIPGESCQFGYVNLGKFIDTTLKIPNIDLAKLEKVTRLMTRALDNALEISIERYQNETNRSVMTAKRKIGVGVCGLADLLVQMKLPYNSHRARELTRDLLAFINYVSKKESVRLASKRGSFEAIKSAKCRYNTTPGFLESKYTHFDTRFVTKKMWKQLGQEIRSKKLLRNSSTIALPPTGRSSIVINASPGIEPMFSILDNSDEINPYLIADLTALGMLTPENISEIKSARKIGHIESIPADIREVYKTAVEITPEHHLLMVSTIQTVIDESVSKTINLPEQTGIEDILNMYIFAHELNLKGITVYRTGSRKHQPRAVAKM